MIKVISFDLQGTLSASAFSDYFWFVRLPQIYAQKNNVPILEAKQYLKQFFTNIGKYDIRYYDDAYWSKLLDFDMQNELKTCPIKPQLNLELIDFIKTLNLKKIIISTTTNNFINFELGESKRLFDNVFSCVDDFKTGGKTPSVYNQIIKLLKVKPEEVLHIGDSAEMDIENAKKSLIKTILFDGDNLATINKIKEFIKGENNDNSH